jgi:beta-glucosidase
MTGRRVGKLALGTGLVLLLLPFSMMSAQTVEERISAIMSQMSMAEKIKQLHAEGGFNTADNTMLGIPGFIMADGPHGVRDGMATSFPVGIGMAATWDPELALRIGIAMGKEFRGKGKHQGLGPCLDIDRDPRNGRSPETGGEDPYLCAQITTAVVKGMQSSPLVATVKHYNANHRENGRTSNNIIASQRVLHEQAGLAFRTAVQQGGALSVMNAYTLINGQKCAENANLLTTILRDHWGFPYYVVSDWGSIWNSENAIKAGCDICMGSDNYKNDLPSLVASGAVSQTVIDAAVRRVLRTKILAGMLDYQPSGNPDDINSTAHQQLCLEAGRKSLVLLKNQENILPLSMATPGTVALIGPNANVAQTDGSGSAFVTPFYGISPRQGIEQLIGAGRVRYVKGCDVNSIDTSGFAAARSAAQGADGVVFVGGLEPAQEGEGFDRLGGSIDLPGKQQDLINALAAVNRKLVVVLFSGGICGIERCVQSIKGLVYAFYPGQEGGRAVAEVLFGAINPGGKLPVTYPLNDAQLPAWNDNLNDDFGCGYRWFDGKGVTPLFSFGFGLSYTTFSYSNLSISPASVVPGEIVTINVDVANTGGRSGDEVAELYLNPVAPSVPVPLKQLKGFKRITLEPGQTTRVTFTITADELYYFNEATSQYDIEAGSYAVRVGGSSDNLPLSGTFQVLDAPRKPDLLIAGVKMVPAYPLPGQKVVFLATVKNQGSAASAAGTHIKTNFTVNGQLVTWCDDFSASILPGGMALLCGNNGPGGSNTWTAPEVGTYSVRADVDPDNTTDECVESNNSSSVQLLVHPAPLPNLALNRSVTVSSVESPGLEGKYAVDGNMGTRWSSAFTDPQFITVDLGAVYRLSEVVLYWESAYARSYAIAVSDSGLRWSVPWNQPAGDGGMDVIPLDVEARYVKMVGLQRATSWGYSLEEFVVHGSPITTGVAAEGPSAPPGSFVLLDNYPNPFNPTTVISYQLPMSCDVTLKVYDLLGNEVRTLVDERQSAGTYGVSFDASTLTSGVYFYRFHAGTFAQTKRLLLIH